MAATRTVRASAADSAPRRPVLRLVTGQHAKAGEERPPKAKRSLADLARRDGSRLVLVTVALNCLGLVMVLSASSVASIDQAGSPWSLFEKQVMWTVIGVFAFLFTRRVDLARVRRLAVPLLFLCGFLLLVVLAPGVGKTVGGSSRWVGAGPIRIQPSELAKIAFAVFVADLVARRGHLSDQAREVIRPVAIVLAAMAILILKQPDMGTAVVLVCIATSVLFAAGMDRRLLAMVMGALFVVGSIVALAAPYRRERLLSFLHPFSSASTSGYQDVQGLVALGSGHLTGTGVGGSVAKWNFLPNAWTDYIFAIIGNELGLIGSIAVVAAFVAFAYFGIRIAARSTDRFSSLLAIAVTCWIVAQAFINIGGVISVLPETGIPLPFLSSGGSSLVVALAGVGLLANIARNASRNTEAVPAKGRPVQGRGRGSTAHGSQRVRSSGRPSTSRRPATAAKRPGGSVRERQSVR